MKKITERQQALFDFYMKLSEDTGRYPSVTELSEKYGKARSTVYETLLSLEKKGYLEREKGTFILPSRQRDENALIRIPLYEGIEDLLEDNTEKYITITRSLGVEDSSFALISHTDEMNGAGIIPGDTLIFQKTEEAGNGRIVLAEIPGEDESLVHVLRRYKERNGMIELVPENDSIGRITTQRCRILGILALKLRKY